jgi:2-polyprenyl-6-methoxyphenol hydroxylase-like FAD-dependent oxidoreductase
MSNRSLVKRDNAVDVDVVIGGGGVAGAVTALALQQLGYETLVVEPGLNENRRLAGELLHPPGVAGLAELGVLDALTRQPAIPVKGFCVVDADDPEQIKLPYDAVRAHSTPGLSLEHGLIRQRLMQAAKDRPLVKFVENARVTHVDQSERSHVTVQVSGRETATQYRCQFLVAADGASSAIRRFAGIGVRNRRIATIFGYRVPIAALPDRDYGLVLIGGRTPVLIYPINKSEARIMFDIPYDADRRPTPEDCLKLVASLPSSIRREIEPVIATQPQMSAVIHEVAAQQLTSGRVVLVGDAAVTCHPLTATGMTLCITDALLLRDAIADRRHDVRQALELHRQRRRWRQVTRLSLAETLRDVFCSGDENLRIVRRGVLRYWRSSSGPPASLALLSTADGRLLALIREFATVLMHSFVGELSRWKQARKRQNWALGESLYGLASVLAHQLRQIRGKCRLVS